MIWLDSGLSVGVTLVVLFSEIPSDTVSNTILPFNLCTSITVLRVTFHGWLNAYC